MVKLVDTKDLKSLPIRECQFESGRGHQKLKMFKKLNFQFDQKDKNSIIKRKILKQYKNYSPRKSQVIVVLGGDGFMLSTIKKFQKYNKPFYGMNRGTFGFLMNKFNINEILKNLQKAKIISISPLEMIAYTANNIKKKIIAINEISLFRQSKQTSSLRIFNGKKLLIKKLISDGVLIATPAGSTAYNLSVHGPILSLDSKKIAVTPISPFRPRRWKGKVLSSKSIIKIENLNIKKRPVNAVADNIEVRSVKKIVAKINKKIKFRLIYNRNNSLIKKIKLEQLRRQTR